MKQYGLGKLYDRLTPEERFKLDVEAMARGDSEESRRLVDTCPRRGYTMTDLQFSGRWDGALHITMATLMDLRQNTVRLRMVDAFRAVLPYSDMLTRNNVVESYFAGRETGSRYAWSKAGKNGDPPGWEEDEERAEENAHPTTEGELDKIEARVGEDTRFIPELLERLERELATEALAVWEAFSSFCEEEMELSPEKLLRAAFAPALEDVGWLKELCERLELEAEKEAVEEYHEHMRGHWEYRLGRG
jgi:hypothetical protein